MTKDFDKVYEVYMDSRESALTLKTRERIHWICRQAAGESVLDVGCSQGITSILLGREQKRVLALDLVEESISFAKEKLCEEEHDVQERVTFVTGDFLSYDFKGQIFDTIIMTEVLEHVPDVEQFLKKAAVCADTRTKFVITVPFGINDYWDHKRTYYFASLYAQMEDDFKILDVKFMGDKWLGVVAVLRDKSVQEQGDGVIPDKERMLQEEENFFKIERRLLDENAKYRQRMDERKGKNEKLREQNHKLRERNDQLQNKNDKLLNQINQLQEKIQELRERTVFLERRVKVLDRRWRTANTRLETLKRNYADVNERYQVLSQSMAGRMQLFYWRVKAYIKRKFSIPQQEVPSLQVQKADTIKRERQAAVDKIPDFMHENVVMNDVYEFSWKEGYLSLRDAVCDTGYYERMRDAAAQLPDSNGSRYYGKLPYKIGMIADEFLYRSFADTADIFYLTPDHYEHEIDLLFVASAWRGLHNEWKGLGNVKNSELRSRLYEIIDYYKGLGKKIIFYSKEDPSNYYVFLDIAKKCDYIFTTAEECVEHYKKDTGVEQVRVLEFSVNPVQFHPIGMQMFHYEEVLFAGTWWNKKYPERKEDMEEIFQNVLRAGKKLKIIDRNYSLGNPDYFYPEKYLKYVSPEMEHAVLQKIHKMHSWSVNINSIKNSTTMFASRVYELMALGNLIISNKSVGMEQRFPDIIIEDGSGRSAEALQSYTEEEIYEKKIAGIRRVMTGETTFDRVRTIMECIGEPAETHEKTAGIILLDENVQSLRKMAEAQTYPYKVVIPKSKLNQKIYEECDIIAFFDADSEYADCYLEDMINAFKYTDSDFITKQAYYLGDERIDGIEHNYVAEYEELGRTVFWRSSYELGELLDGSASAGKQGYSIDCLHYKKMI